MSWSSPRGRSIAQVSSGVDWALAVLGRNDNQRRVVQTPGLEQRHHPPDGRVGECDLSQQRLARRADIVQIAARHPHGLFDQLLADADHLKVHPKDLWNRSAELAAVIPAVDLVEDRLHLQAVVALDVLEAVRPGIRRSDRRLIRKRVAAGHGGQRYRNRVDFRRVVIVDVRTVARTRDRGVGRMLVRPGSVAPCRMHNAKNRIRANEAPRIDGIAVMGRIALEPHWIDRRDAAVRAVWRSPVQ
jgi:hypothetical protein